MDQYFLLKRAVMHKISKSRTARAMEYGEEALQYAKEKGKKAWDYAEEKGKEGVSKAKEGWRKHMTAEQERKITEEAKKSVREKRDARKKSRELWKDDTRKPMEGFETRKLKEAGKDYATKYKAATDKEKLVKIRRNIAMGGAAGLGAGTIGGLALGSRG